MILLVVNGKVTNKIDYLSAIDEGQYVIAQANASLAPKGEFIEQLVSSRHTQDKDARLLWQSVELLQDSLMPGDIVLCDVEASGMVVPLLLLSSERY